MATENHSKIMALIPIKAAVKVLKIRGHFRTVSVSLKASICAKYVDNDGNFIFKEHFLAEYHPKSESSGLVSQGSGELANTINQLATKEESVKSILKYFLVEKYHPRNRNVHAWCKAFETEAARFQLADQRLLEVFKAYIDVSLCDWFSINQSKLGLSAGWPAWKESFFDTFADSTWQPVRFAFNFKFLSGSYLEYAMRKEKLLIELDGTLLDSTVLDLIVIGLPFHIQDTLNRKTVKTIKQLHEKFKKFETEDRMSDSHSKNSSQSNTGFSNQSKSFASGSSNRRNRSSYSNSNCSKGKSDQSEKKYCSICAKLGSPGRTHQESMCWNKNRLNQKESNFIKKGEPETLLKINEADSKN